MERGCVADQLQQVKRSKPLENSKGAAAGRGRHSRAPAFFKQALTVGHPLTMPRQVAGNIPKGFYHSARRCHDNGVATPGGRTPMPSTLKELNPSRRNGDATPLGLMIV